MLPIYLKNLVQMSGLKEKLKICCLKAIQTFIRQMVHLQKKRILWMSGLIQALHITHLLEEDIHILVICILKDLTNIVAGLTLV